MAEIESINGIAVASVSKIYGVARSGIDNIHGLTFPSGGTPTTYLAKQSSWGNGSADGTSGIVGYGAVPTGWQTNTYALVYGITSGDRKWSGDTDGDTSSGFTGPTRGHDPSASDGREAPGTTDDIMYTEVSSQFNKRFLLRTPEFNFSNSLSNSTLKLEFWFHMYGSNIGNLGVAATDSSTSAGDDTLSLHFLGDTSGGCTIVYWDDASDDGSSTASGVRITGQQQAFGNGSTNVGAHWRKATVDLNSVAGQSSVYLWFFSKSTSSYRGDVCIDDVLVTGEE